ncbi:MAG: cyclic nucleotide-binding domain-containing protein, partial [Gammaproteobacteria bacterium]
VEDGVIKIKGSLYYGSLPYVQRRVKDAVDNQGGKLTLDLRNASYDDAEAERWLREVQAKGASKVIGSTEQIGAFIPQSLNEDRRKELLDSARFFELKAGESSILLADSENDCLRVISGRVTVHGPSGEIFSLEPSRDRGCPCSFAKKGASLQIEANEDSLLCQLNQDEVDFLVGWQELSRAFGRQDSELERRMEKIRASLIFRQLPVEAIEEALKRMKTEEVKSGQDVVRQWEVGETFYVIDEGTAEVWREEFHGDDPECVAVLTAGDSFGEEALLTGKERGATVRMTSDGRLLVLAKSDFVRLVSRPMIREEAPEIAKAMLTDGYKLLDVRYEEEWYESRIPNAILIPLPDLRNQMDELSQSSRYLVYCRSGKRSAVAAFLMTQRGIEAVSLKGGILEWPYEKESSIPEKKQKTDE